MKLSQLRIIEAMSRHKLNVSETADALFTSQPAVSKQIKSLEEELGAELFERHGKLMVDFTPLGRELLPIVRKILGQTEQIKTIAKEHSNPHLGQLRIGTTHTQARYVLPPIVRRFGELFPRVQLNIYQGTPNQLAEMLQNGTVDLVIATEAHDTFDNFVMLPCHRWERAVLVPKEHPLHNLYRLDGITLEALSAYPLVSYVFAFTGSSPLDQVFRDAGLEPNVALTAVDTDIIKTYVEMGLGVGIIAEMAFDEAKDSNFALLEMPGMLPSSTTAICVKKHSTLREFHYAFIELFSSLFPRERVEALRKMDERERMREIANIDLPNF